MSATQQFDLSAYAWLHQLRADETMVKAIAIDKEIIDRSIDAFTRWCSTEGLGRSILLESPPTCSELERLIVTPPIVDIVRVGARLDRDVVAGYLRDLVGLLLAPVDVMVLEGRTMRLERRPCLMRLALANISETLFEGRIYLASLAELIMLVAVPGRKDIGLNAPLPTTRLPYINPIPTPHRVSIEADSLKWTAAILAKSARTANMAALRKLSGS